MRFNTFLFTRTYVEPPLTRLYHCNPWTDTAKGICPSFELYCQDPIKFFMQRFEGMTILVARFLATRVFCLLGDSLDDGPRVSAKDFSFWAENLPAHFSDPGNVRTILTSSTQGHPLAYSLPPSRPSSRQASVTNTISRLGSRFASRVPSFARRFGETELPTVLDNDNGEVLEEEVQPDSRTPSNTTRRERGAWNECKNARSGQVDPMLETLAEASQTLARETIRSSGVSDSERAMEPLIVDGGQMPNIADAPDLIQGLSPHSPKPSRSPARERTPIPHKPMQYAQHLDDPASTETTVPLGVRVAEKGTAGGTVSLWKPLRQLFNSLLSFKNLLSRTSPGPSESEGMTTADVETDIGGVKDEKIKDDMTRDVISRIDGLSTVKRFAVPKPSSILIEERAVLQATPSSSVTLRPGVEEAEDLWFVVFDEVVLKCQRVGTTLVPGRGAYGSRADSISEAQVTVPFVNTSQRKLRNLYRFIEVYCTVYVWFGICIDELARLRRGMLTAFVSALLQWTR